MSIPSLHRRDVLFGLSAIHIPSNAEPTKNIIEANNQVINSVLSATLAEAQAAAVSGAAPVGMMVTVYSYAVPSDGGGFVGVVDEADNAVYPGKGRIRPVSNIVTPQMFGWPGGMMDVTPYAQAAANFGHLYFPDGEYTVAGTISMVRDGQRIFGASRNATLRRAPLHYEPLIESDGYHDVSINTLSIDGNKRGCPLKNGSFTPSGGGVDVVLQNQGDVVLRNGARGVIEDVRFSNSATSPATLYGMTDSFISDCQSTNHAREGHQIVAGARCVIARNILIGETTSPPWSLISTAWGGDHRIEHNRCVCSQAALITINSLRTMVYNNDIDQPSGVSTIGPGIRLGHNKEGFEADGSRVDDNIIRNVPFRGISVDNAANTEIINNHIYKCLTGIGVSVSQNTNVIINSNTISSSMGIGIDVYNAIGGEVTNNRIKDCVTGIRLSARNLMVMNNRIWGTVKTGYKTTWASGLNSGHLFIRNIAAPNIPTPWSIASSEKHRFVDNPYSAKTIELTAITGAMPSVEGAEYLQLSQGHTTEVTSMTGAVSGAHYFILFGDSLSTLKHGGQLRLKDEVDVTPPTNAYMTFRADGIILHETSRSF